jgi:hypothetical protein
LEHTAGAKMTARFPSLLHLDYSDEVKAMQGLLHASALLRTDDLRVDEQAEPVNLLNENTGLKRNRGICLAKLKERLCGHWG